MIRINLLAREKAKQRTPRRERSFEPGQQVTVACTLILLAAFLGTGWWFWSLRKDSTRLNDEIAAAQQETDRLRSLIVQVRQYETRKIQLQQRVTLIETLRKGQSGPVHMLDQISRSLPDMLWLTEMKQNGSEVSIIGRCTVQTSVSDLVSNLENSGWFKRPVEIVESQVEKAAGTGAEIIRFTVKAQFAPPPG